MTNKKLPRVGIFGDVGVGQLFCAAMGDKMKVVNLASSNRLPRGLDRIDRTLYFVKRLRQVDLVYFIGVWNNTEFYARLANLFGKKVIYHWLGTDVLNHTKGIHKIGKHHAHVDRHLAYAPNLRNELRTLGIDSSVYPIVPDKMDMSSARMPKQHAVLLCIPDDTQELADFYGYQTMIRVIQAFPKLPFYVVRAQQKDLYPYPNVVFKGIIPLEEMNKLYDEISIVIRYPQHDGLSLLLMESTIKGKYLIYNFEHPYARHADTFEAICREITQILQEPPIAQMEESRYGVANYNQEKCRQEGLRHVHEVLD